MKTLIVSTHLSLTLVTGCSKKKSDCEAIYEHTKSLLPKDMQSQLAGNKAEGIAKCEKASPEARECAANAKSLEDLMKCPKS